MERRFKGVRYLLDTHITIWLIVGDKALKADTLDVIFDEQSEIFVSVESLREIVIKAKLNKVNFAFMRNNLISAIADDLTYRLGATLLNTTVAHTQRLQELNPVHNDPFDHLLICQAIDADLVMISADEKFPAYRRQGLNLLPA